MRKNSHRRFFTNRYFQCLLVVGCMVTVGLVKFADFLFFNKNRNGFPPESDSYSLKYVFRLQNQTEKKPSLLLVDADFSDFSDSSAFTDFSASALATDDFSEETTLAEKSPSSPYHQNPTEFKWCFTDQKSDAEVSEESALPFNCTELFANENPQPELLTNAQEWTPSCWYSDEDMARISENCAIFRRKVPFWSEHSHPPIKNRRYSLAFVLLAHKNAEQTVRLLQHVYHPDNVYCITYDNDSDSSDYFKRTLRNVDACYANIITPDIFRNVSWGGFSVLNSIMDCMRVLHKDPRIKHIRWRYVQILSGNDFPLRTNQEMIRIMQILNGSQDSELTASQPERYRKYHKESSLDFRRLHNKKSIAPGGLILYKGGLAVTLSRKFVAYLMTNRLAVQFFQWCNTTFTAEEHFWSTLVHNLQAKAPGNFPGSCLHYYEFEKTFKKHISRYQIWYDGCGGKLVSGSCVYGVSDLPKLARAVELVAHKFYLDFQPATYYCMAELHYKRTFGLQQQKVDSSWSWPELNVAYYQNLPGVKYHNSKNKDEFEC